LLRSKTATADERERERERGADNSSVASMANTIHDSLVLGQRGSVMHAINAGPENAGLERSIFACRHYNYNTFCLIYVFILVCVARYEITCHLKLLILTDNWPTEINLYHQTRLRQLCSGGASSILTAAPPVCSQRCTAPEESAHTFRHKC